MRLNSRIITRAFTVAALVFALSCSVSCEGDDMIDPEVPEKPEDEGNQQKPEETPKDGIELFTNPAAERSISFNGETLTCVLEATGPYEAELVLLSGSGDWASLVKGHTGEAGRNNIRIVFDPNDSDSERQAELFVQVKDNSKVSVAKFTQSADGMSDAVKQNVALNTYMHEILLEEYLWADEYSELDVDLEMDYTKFLHEHLTRLGDVNIEDGGHDRFNKGARFVYSNIQEVPVSTRAYETGGLGFGPIFASQITPDGLMGLSVAYVHQGSPAYNAGMKRGDTIYKVNGISLTSSNYQTYMNQLYYSPSGSYKLEFIRDADFESAFSVEVAVASYVYNPVLYSAVMKEDEHVIGYLVLENFDLGCQEFVVDIIDQFAGQNITDLILDLRFNPGGAVAQSRYLTSAIAGSAHLDDVFVNVEFRDGKTQAWKFRGGPNDQDNLGIATDLGLDRLYVIGSYGTASASELVINSLRGIDFPVYLYGGRTEGKNVGMTTTQTSYKGRNYMFSPITFRVSNAKGFGDYPDGFEPDVLINNQNDSYSDDIDNVFPYSFGDWGDMGFNKALYHAYKDIVGSDSGIGRASAPSKEMARNFIPMDHTGVEMVYGRFGNVIYR